MESIKSAETPELSTHHSPIGHEGVWHSRHPPKQLPAYLQNVRNALMRAGHDEGSAHAMALSALRRWAEGGGHVTPEVQAASRNALEEFEKLQAHHE